MATGYHYRPLKRPQNELRLLSIDANLLSDDEPLKFRMEHVELSERERPPSYVALSYTWGDAERRKNLMIDGEIVSVPENTESALRNLISAALRLPRSDLKRSRFILRPFSRRVRLWIDAVCIDQSNWAERGQQVAIMWRIYSKAAVVLAWLGPDDGYTERFRKAASAILEHCRHHTNNFKDLEDKLWTPGQQDFKFRQFNPATPPISDWACIEHLFSAPWFQRLWIIQETVLANKFFAVKGTFIMPWEEIGTVASWLFHLCYFDEMNFGDRIPGLDNAELIDRARTSATARNLSYLLSSTESFKTSVAQDRVYGILGLLPRQGWHTQYLERFNPPDYSASIQETYARAVKASIHMNQDLSIIYQAQIYADDLADESAADDFPSWVPRLHQEIRDENGGLLRANPLAESTTVPGSCNRLPLALHDSFDHILMAKGTILDAVEETVTISTCKTRGELFDAVSRCWEVANKHGSCSLMTFAQTLSLDKREPYSSFDPNRERLGWLSFLEYCRSPYEDTLAEDIRFDCDDLAYLLYGRLFFVTTSGFVGMGPASLRKGDMVSILFSANIPLILRPELGNTKSFRLVGDAYVGGTMEGEYIQRLQNRSQLESQTEWITIL